LRWSYLHWRRKPECHPGCRAYPGSANVKRQRQAVPPDRHARQFLNHHLFFVLPQPSNATPESSNLICCTQCLALLSSLSYLNGTTFPRNHPSVATAAPDAVGFCLRTHHYQLHGRPRDPRTQPSSRTRHQWVDIHITPVCRGPSHQEGKLEVDWVIGLRTLVELEHNGNLHCTTTGRRHSLKTT
jgi:hypothetical protein